METGIEVIEIYIRQKRYMVHFRSYYLSKESYLGDRGENR